MRIVATIRGRHLVRWTFHAFWEIPTAREKQTNLEGTPLYYLTSWLQCQQVFYSLSGIVRLIFLSDPGKPGVRSLGPDVRPSQTNSDTL